MFKLLRYFSITSLLAMVIATIALGAFYHRIAVERLIESGGSNNIGLTRIFSNHLQPELRSFLKVAAHLSNDALRSHPQTSGFRQAVLEHMSGLPVVKIKIYDLKGRTIFSTETKQIGEDKRSNAGFLSARSGKAISELIHKDTLDAFEGVIENRDLISSYIPIHSGGSGPVEAVFVLYYDVTPLLQKIENTQKSVLVVVVLILTLLYTVLFFVVRHADGIIKRQYAELVGANQKLAKVNREKDEYIGIMSHELKTPLYAMVVNAGMVQQGVFGKLNEDQNNALGEILKNANELTAMVNGVLNFAKLEAGKAKVESQELSLKEFLDDLRLGYDFPLGKPLAVDWDYPADLPPVQTDGAKLKHILQNLINNAIKYTERGKITVSARHRPESGSVEFRVADTGIGIPQEKLPTIFEMFRQVDGSTSRDQGGVGLGLYIVKNFTKMLGGQVEVKSEPGRGSVFTVTIPKIFSMATDTARPA